MRFAKGVLVVLLLLGSAPILAQTAQFAQPVDGGTIELGGRQVRLYGIKPLKADDVCKTPGGTTIRCGAEAIAMLSKLISGRPVTCRAPVKAPDGGLAAECFVNNLNLSIGMLVFGYARRATEEGPYVTAESTARLGKEGIWGYEAP